MLSCSLHTKGFSGDTAAEILGGSPNDTYIFAHLTPGASALLTPEVAAWLHPQTTTGTAYGLTYEVGDRPLRLRKDALTDGSLGDSPVACRWVAIDVDNPEHAEWPSLAAARAAIEAFPSSDLLRPLIVHSTPRGLHAWYALQEPLEPEAFELALRWIHLDLQRQGVAVDTKACDWTRLTSLPRRDHPHYHQRVDPDARIDGYTILERAVALGFEAQAKHQVTPEAQATHSPDFDSDAAYQAAFPGGDSAFPGPLATRIQTRLRGWLGHNAGSPHAALAEAVATLSALPSGHRDQACAVSTGWLVSFAMREVHKAGEDLDELFVTLAGLVDYVAELTDHEGTQDNGDSWRDKAIPKLIHYWGHDRAEFEAVAQLREAAAPPIPPTPSAKYPLPPLLSMGTGFLALQPDGSYSTLYGTLNQAVGDTIRTGIALRTGIQFSPDNSNKTKVHSTTKIQQDFLGQASLIDDRVYPRVLGPEERVPAYLPMSMPDPMRVEIVEYGVCIRSNVPRYDAWVERYLHQLGKTDDDQRALLLWLQNYPRWFDRQLPMLILYGDPRTGKSLLLNALALMAPSVQLDGSANSVQYNHSIATGVALLWDDTQPVSGHRYTDTLAVVDNLLRLTMGQRVQVRQKYRDDREVSRPWRLIHTYNSLQFAHTVFRHLGSAHERGRRAAVASRIAAVGIRPESRQWILDNPSPYDEQTTLAAVAQHVLWLSENPPIEEGHGVVEQNGYVHVVTEAINRIASQSDETTLDHQEHLVSICHNVFQDVSQSPKAAFYKTAKFGVVLGIHVRHVLAALTDATSTPEVKREVRYFLDSVCDFNVPDTLRATRLSTQTMEPISEAKTVRIRALKLDAIAEYADQMTPQNSKRLEELVYFMDTLKQRYEE